VHFLRLFAGAVLEGPQGAVTGPPAQRRRLALLSILVAARGRPVSRERLVGLLWPEHPQSAARRLLSESLYVLRKHLGDDVFATGSDDVVLRTAVLGSDLTAFEEALERGNPEEAARLYSGPFLDGLYVPDAPEFERWVEEERSRVARAYARAVEELGNACEARGELEEAARWWERVVASDPYSSRLVLRLMRALSGSGEPAAAIRAFDAHSALLRRDLEVEPASEVAAFVERLRVETRRAEGAQPVAPAAVGARDVPQPRSVETLTETDPPEGKEERVTAREAMTSADTQPRLVQPPPATERREEAEEPVTAPPAMSSRSPQPRPAPPLRGGGGDRPAWSLAYYGGLFGLMVGFALSVISAGGGRRGSSTPEGADYPPYRIAVLYFDDLSPGDTLEYLAHGLTQRLVHELTQVQALDVVSLGGVRPYRYRAVPLDSIAAQLRAGSFVQGSVMKHGGMIRVIVSLTDAKTGRELESHTIEQKDGDLFMLMDEAVRQVAVFLRKRVGEEVRLVRMRGESNDVRALALVLQAEKAREEAREMARTADPRDMTSSLDRLDSGDSLLVRAEEYDPEWAAPKLLRGWLALDRAVRGARAREVSQLRAALLHAERALELTTDSAEALELHGTALWRWVVTQPDAAEAEERHRAAEAELERAVALAPHRAGAWITLSQLYRARGYLTAADVAARRAKEEDAFLSVADVGAERLYRVALAFARYDQAREWCHTGRRDFPLDYRFLECALTLLARDRESHASPDSALRVLRALDALDPPEKARAAGRPYTPPYRQMMLAAVLARAGKSDSARAVMARALEGIGNDPSLRSSWFYDAAFVHLLLEDPRRSAALLDSFTAAHPTLRGSIARDPLFAPLRR
jgi:DNA-binding SARP family transcriptional activator/TolB-like protein